MDIFLWELITKFNGRNEYNKKNLTTGISISSEVFFLSGKFSFNSSNLFIKYAFEIAKADAVHLNVFPENPSAKKCYEKVGFKERTLTENAFSFKDESWGRCNMITTR